ncbi:T9SS type A sorting domain-containing protein [Flavobacterium subsaxonicum]|uniref:Secretion system C-terminal sorting domain-containing protein n=1 Tax=Flavobacterium subsaxonicum WB 4.1-42 = DSM 21790 TaxID=1121898 RepID=A0A0A2N317_9FLAO|nr:T9SS type A sorting domain-containing protein [Flavobacterium subsaxonicum]KGO94855.1 hypothetical protein Q766_01690 [Flavobacterium subsaxonicum WB 4.1-42 = DSM 21790]
MKKQLLLAAFLMGSFFTVKAQTFQSDDFNALIVGNLVEDFTGVTAGQGDWYAGGTNNGAAGTTTTTTNMTDASVIQVVDGGEGHGNVLQIEGPNGNYGAAYAWKTGLADFWDARTEGNDLLEVEFDYYTGAPGASLNNMRVAIFNEDSSKLLSGINLATSTGIISGLGYYTSTPGTGTYIFGLNPENTTSANVILPENTWIRAGFSYNVTTGEIIFKYGEYSVSIEGAAPGEIPGEIDFYAAAGSTTSATNTESATGWFDNIAVKTSASDSLLAVKDVVAATQFSIFPNPATNVINVTNADNTLVNNVAIVDVNGRTVKSVKFNGAAETQVNISDLASGVYMVTIASENGTTTKKIVKN